MFAKSLDYSNGDLVSYEEFISIANSVKCKVEYIDGRIYFLAGGSRKHRHIKNKIAKLLNKYFDDDRCEVEVEDALHYIDEKLKKKTWVYPDIMVVCDFNNFVGEDYFGKPKLIIEVLSKSTGYVDENDKKELYKRLGIEEYLIVDQYKNKISVCHLQSNNESTNELCLSKGDVFKSRTYADLELRLDDIFNYNYK